MIKNLRIISYAFILCFGCIYADSNLSSIIQALTGASPMTQSQNNTSNSMDPTIGVVSSLMQQNYNNVLESPTSVLKQEGAWYIFRNGNWLSITENDNFTNMNVALLIHDLAQDKSHLLNLASIIANISENVNVSSEKKYFQTVLAFEYPSMKSFKNRNGQDELISSVGEKFALQLILGVKNVKSLTVFSHGLGGLVARYTLEKEFPNLIKSNENDYKNIYNKIKLITLGTFHNGIPKQVVETAYKNFVVKNTSNTLISSMGQQVDSFAEQKRNEVLGKNTVAAINAFLPGLIHNPSSLIGNISQKDILDYLPVIKEIESGSNFLISLNNNIFNYADQTNYFTIAGTKSADFQIGLGNRQTEVGTGIQSIYESIDNMIKSDGLVSQSSANAKELSNVCIDWAKDSSNRSYTLAVNHAELISNSSNQAFIQQVLPVIIKVLGLSKVLTDSSTVTLANNPVDVASSNASVPSTSVLNVPINPSDDKK